MHNLFFKKFFIDKIPSAVKKNKKIVHGVKYLGLPIQPEIPKKYKIIKVNKKNILI
tara:strand:+ start:368 stop:535 length:168 start_codon:yes stop_codon:yes gene_type:complete